jgi:hypothetical protein
MPTAEQHWPTASLRQCCDRAPLIIIAWLDCRRVAAKSKVSAELVSAELVLAEIQHRAFFANIAHLHSRSSGGER